ncbi:NAD(P)H-dependent oxidoreductase [Candidatus Uhrbacteria bacterium]|nr:NAD(P)H-dependent oxidoreductase [Candidatus Uhrbacteria bacterium]
MFFKKNRKKEPKLLLIQGSLSPHSKTSLLIDEAAVMLKKKGVAHYEIFDIRTYDLDFCNGRELNEYSQDTQKAFSLIESADAYIFGMPVYCYSISGGLKNLIDLTSNAMQDKIAGIMCNSSGIRSYLASLDLLKILSYEAHITTVQPIVHTYKESFKNDKIFDEKVLEVMEEMIDGLIKFMKA